MTHIFESKLTKCVVCGIGDIVLDTSHDSVKDPLIIYGRNGTSTGIHRAKKCNNKYPKKPCRVNYYFGYYKYKNKKIFEQDCLRQNILITSNQTAFEVQYLYEVALDVHFSNSNFESLCEKYNNLHFSNLPHDVLQRRQDLY